MYKDMDEEERRVKRRKMERREEEEEMESGGKAGRRDGKVFFKPGEKRKVAFIKQEVSGSGTQSLYYGNEADVPTGLFH